LENPEVGVAFSNNDSPDPLRFIKMSNFVKGEEQPIVEHFESISKMLIPEPLACTQSASFSLTPM
jgi:hypothetical protein